ncbi:MarR family transcriptional regulator [Kitasatospora sp. NBC_00240]|uniref:MarR family winged helix-turn-helix transcriptional regulator n=1 Tax=Kitasatospora sp. NBC_00240 TaxID=2903567 RepID=UPI002251D0C8|nr:MarR family transcriptional regulator [Kitasatospora sp. NBC_00240]MCX5209190.1 MarR family transcriptional regulator [Kitasatospora sp. NBC_00240]
MPETPLTHLQTLPSWLLGRASALGHRLVADQFAREGVRLPHHAVLCGVAEHGPLAQAELARLVRIDPKDMVAVLNDLQAKELVTRTPDPRDRRKNAIALSPAGHALLARLQILGDEANAALLAPLDPEERTRLAELLARVVAAPRD